MPCDDSVSADPSIWIIRLVKAVEKGRETILDRF
jgi:hypothetical protein